MLMTDKGKMSKKEFGELKDRYDAQIDQLKRLQADFDNYRKRVEKERID
ncbi:MAG: nucleotide exchange factor GrpE, partial [archaeon]|nr:nucleotide exchange factor GrpE [archaeon]